MKLEQLLEYVLSTIYRNPGCTSLPSCNIVSFSPFLSADLPMAALPPPRGTGNRGVDNWSEENRALTLRVFRLRQTANQGPGWARLDSAPRVARCLSLLSATFAHMYRARNKGMQILLSNSQAGPGRTVKQEQEEISRNHVQAFIPGSVL